MAQTLSAAALAGAETDRPGSEDRATLEAAGRGLAAGVLKWSGQAVGALAEWQDRMLSGSADRTVRALRMCQCREGGRAWPCAKRGRGAGMGCTTA